MLGLAYSGLEFKAGLECHQQLDTKKLFCRCPTILREDAASGTVKRFLRPSASEMGEFDAAALEQFQRGHSYFYEYHNDTNCEIELDEAPPKDVEQQALKTALEVALMANANVLKKIFVMRKLVIDGSNTSGFQRTALVALGGKIKIKNKDIGIQTIVLEEDSARPIRKNGSEISYRLDRLGIPLIELATEPELHTPEEVKEAALAIGKLFRLTGKAKRGLGTIRQDINVSIKGGTRIEIKGVQDLEGIDEYVRREIGRQKTLLEIKEELKKRGVAENDLDEKWLDITGVFSGTQCGFIKNAKQSAVLAVRLKNFKKILGTELQPGRRFGTELSDYVKARSNVSGIVHSDELPAYGISEKETEETKKALSCGQNDAFVFVVAEKERAEKAIRIALERCKAALRHIPAETRNALEGGNTEYSRPLSGSARMYPETDLAPIEIPQKELAEIKKGLPLNEEERFLLYTKKFGLSEKLASQMKLNNFARFFEELANAGLDPTTTATVLLNGLKHVKRMGADTNSISNEMLKEFFNRLDKGEIKREIYTDVLADWTKNPQKTLLAILSENHASSAGREEVEKTIKEIVEKNKKLIKEKGTHATAALMGEAMQKLKGHAGGKEVSEILAKEIEKAVKK